MKRAEFVSELNDKSVEELVQTERQLRDELFRLRMKHFSGQLQKPSELKRLKRDIARVLTIRKEKESQ